MKMRAVKAMGVLVVTTLFMAVTCFTSAESQYPCGGVVRKPDVNVRKEASVQSSRVMQLEKNDTVTVLGEETNNNALWYRVEYEKEKTGYVRADLIELEVFESVVEIVKLSEEKQHVSFGDGYALTIPSNLIEYSATEYNELDKDWGTILDDGSVRSAKTLFGAEDEEGTKGIVILRFDLAFSMSLSEWETALEDAEDEMGKPEAMLVGNIDKGILTYFKYKTEEDGTDITVNMIVDKQPALYMIIFAGYTDDGISDIMASIEFERRLLADWMPAEDNGLRFYDYSGVNGKNYFTVTGRIKNESQNRYEYVRVKAVFKDNKGEILDTNWTYLVGDEGLEPQESKTFSISVPSNDDIDLYELSILDYNKD